MGVYEELTARGLIAQVTNEEEIRKLVNAGKETKKANVNLSRFGLKKLAKKTVLKGNPEDENNYEAQPIAPKTEELKARKKFAEELAPYSMVMYEYSL